MNNEEERLNALTNQLRRLQLEQRTVEREIQTIRQGIRARKSRVIHTDHNGDEIRIGNKVRFLTKGKYKSREGRIVKFGERFVTSEDNRGNKIFREYGNVELIIDSENEQ